MTDHIKEAAAQIRALPIYAYLSAEAAHGFACAREAAAAIVEAMPAQAVTVKPLTAAIRSGGEAVNENLTPALDVMAMREAAVNVVNVTCEVFRMIGYAPFAERVSEIVPLIKALPLPDHAAVLAEAMKLPEVVALVEAATPYVSPVQNADYGRQMRQYEALVAALTALKGKSHE